MAKILLQQWLFHYPQVYWTRAFKKHSQFFEFRKKLSVLYIHLSNKVYTVNFIYISFSQYKNLRTLSGTLECVLNTN